MFNRVGYRPQWRGQSDTSLRRLSLLVLASLLVHAPFTPLAAVFGLVAALQVPDEEAFVDMNAESAIPVDLIEEPAGGQEEPASGTPTPEQAAALAKLDELLADDDWDDEEDDDDDWEAPVRRRPRRKPVEEKARDAGAPATDAGRADAGLDAGATAADADAAPTSDAAPPPEAGVADAGAADAAAADAGGGKAAREKPVARRSGIGDPVAMSGGAGQVVDANADIRLLVFNSRIRKHSVGKKIGGLLSKTTQWRDFLGTAKLDPIKDFDRILIAAPQLRDSSKAVILIEHRMSEKQLKAALDRLVKRSKKHGGKWLEDAALPTASARADGAPRVFVIASPKVVVIGPPGTEKQAAAIGNSLKFPSPKGDEALTTYVKEPWKAFVGIPFRVPKTIRWVRMKIEPRSDGGVEAKLELQDASPEAAKASARLLENGIIGATTVKIPGALAKLLGKKEKSYLEQVRFTAKGSKIHGHISVSESQLETVLEAVQELSEIYAHKRKKPKRLTKKQRKQKKRERKKSGKQKKER